MNLGLIEGIIVYQGEGLILSVVKVNLSLVLIHIQEICLGLVRRLLEGNILELLLVG